ncbi:MAG: hypothetical protein BGO31_11085 [Bacteroidetes bacterium 43-16]|uniref:histidine kinase n=1 Tax=uncultured Dysgonomonas sp. TaxID=206096 RepID=UPI000928274E|nr:histidine kinase [uncultured Dysgonomonas sp.]OJV51003.1 MAG: hypothetical protein BGO31_11085 [Bacteroidetes bacterium 43-16]
MTILDKMINPTFRPVKVPFSDFNTEIRLTFKQKTARFIKHFLIVACFIFIEITPELFGNEEFDYWKYLPFHLFDVILFFILFYYYFPFVLRNYKKPALRFVSGIGAVFGYGILLHLFESAFKYVKTGLLEFNWTFRSFHYSTARGTLISLIAYLLSNNKYVVQVEREIAARRTRELELNNDLLRAQLDPHLVNNVLSVLYDRILNYSEDDTEIIRLLSGLTSHAIGQSDDKGHISLMREINNIKDYIRMQELCKEKHINVAWKEDIFEEITLPPKILLEPIINALKYGEISDTKPIEISICLSKEKVLSLRTFNYKAIVMGMPSHSVGLNNLKERLRLNYPDKHTLCIEETDTTFELNLNVTLCH